MGRFLRRSRVPTARMNGAVGEIRESARLRSTSSPPARSAVARGGWCGRGRVPRSSRTRRLVASELVTTFAPSATGTAQHGGRPSNVRQRIGGVFEEPAVVDGDQPRRNAPAGRRSWCRARRRDVPSRRSTRRRTARPEPERHRRRDRQAPLRRPDACPHARDVRSEFEIGVVAQRVDASMRRRCRCRCAARGAVRRRSPRSGAWVHRHADAQRTCAAVRTSRRLVSLMPTAFVTGITGQDGQHLAEFLHGQGYRGVRDGEGPEQPAGGGDAGRVAVRGVGAGGSGGSAVVGEGVGGVSARRGVQPGGDHLRGVEFQPGGVDGEHHRVGCAADVGSGPHGGRSAEQSDPLLPGVSRRRCSARCARHRRPS